MVGLKDDAVNGEARSICTSLPCGASFEFDPALAARLASEVEDHLRDAVDADPSGPSVEAERRAVDRFGLARKSPTVRRRRR